MKNKVIQYSVTLKYLQARKSFHHHNMASSGLWKMLCLPKLCQLQMAAVLCDVWQMAKWMVKPCVPVNCFEPDGKVTDVVPPTCSVCDWHKEPVLMLSYSSLRSEMLLQVGGGAGGTHHAYCKLCRGRLASSYYIRTICWHQVAQCHLPNRFKILNRPTWLYHHLGFSSATHHTTLVSSAMCTNLVSIKFCTPDKAILFCHGESLTVLRNISFTHQIL